VPELHPEEAHQAGHVPRPDRSRAPGFIQSPYRILEDSRDTVAENIMLAFKGIWDNSWGPNLERLFLFGARGLPDIEGSTLLGLWKILKNKPYRNSIINRCTNPLALAFWHEDFPTWVEKSSDVRTDPVLNKIERVLFHSAI
jgi:hypothetical protein